jgi:hypothetical protein
MTEAKVRDFRGCERADIEVDPIALVAGRNGSGKTSAAQAIGAVLTGEAIPMRGVNKTQAGVLVRAGREAGAATVQSSEGTGRIDWPACTRRTENKPPEASAFAAGITSVADLAPAERVKVLSTYLRADPTRDDLARAIADHPELDAEAVTAAVWDLIERSGWDGALLARRDRGAEFKGQWRQVTGANYGSRIAASWRQELDEERRTEAELVAVVESARQEHEHAIGSSAASAADRTRLQELAATGAARNVALASAEAEVDARQKELDAAIAQRQELPPAEVGAEAEIPCPSCGTLLNVRRSATLLDPPVLAIASTTPLPAADVKARRMAIADADGKVAHARDAVHLAQRARSTADTALQAAIEAGKQLAALPPATEHQVDTAATRAEVERAEAHLVAVRAKREADKIAARIAGNEKVIDLLAPDGLRRKKLFNVVDAFNTARLAPLCRAGNWRMVSVDADLEIAYGGRHFALLSGSEQFRVRVSLAVAMAQLDGSAMLIVDAADVLDGPARGDLFELLRAGGVPAIVLMTLARREQAPDLAAAGLGRTYWLDSGVTHPLREEMTDAA